MSNKIIGIDARMMGTEHGGIGRYIFEVVSRVVRQDPTNSYVVFYNPLASSEIEIRSFGNLVNVRLVPVPIRHYSIGEQTRFYWLLKKYNFDLVHFPNFNVPLLYDRPFVVTIHDIVHHKISGHKKSRWLQFYAYKKIIEHAAKNSKKIITVSEYSKRDIAGVFQVPHEKISVTYEGTALPETASPLLVDKVKKYFLLEKPYLLFVGTLERKKNVVQLSRGFDVLIKKYGHDVDLVIAGKIDKHYPEIKHKALDIKNNTRVIFTGYVEDEELVALYHGAQAFVSASLHEGFGLPGVEAMKSGLPLIVSNIEVFNEIYDNAAVYFDPNDPNDIAEKMNIVVKDQQFRSQLSVHSRARSQLFDWDRTAAETLKVFRSV
jgi:glycosyltransferase involved in cell wall biosynthesis